MLPFDSEVANRAAQAMAFRAEELATKLTHQLPDCACSVTATSLAEFATEAAARVAAMDEQIGALVAAMDEQIGALVAAMDEQIGALAAAMDEQIGALVAEFDGDYEQIAALVAEFDGDYEEIAACKKEGLEFYREVEMAMTAVVSICRMVAPDLGLVVKSYEASALHWEEATESDD